VLYNGSIEVLSLHMTGFEVEDLSLLRFGMDSATILDYWDTERGQRTWMWVPPQGGANEENAGIHTG
jgi:hypothetical protein